MINGPWHVYDVSHSELETLLNDLHAKYFEIKHIWVYDRGAMIIALDSKAIIAEVERGK